MPFTTDQAPIRNVTPMKTPIVENTLFSFCARIIWSASRSASKKGTLGGLQLVRGDHAVAQRHDAGSVSRNVVLVRDHDDRLAPVVQVAVAGGTFGGPSRSPCSGYGPARRPTNRSPSARSASIPPPWACPDSRSGS